MTQKNGIMDTRVPGFLHRYLAMSETFCCESSGMALAIRAVKLGMVHEYLMMIYPPVNYHRPWQVWVGSGKLAFTNMG
jgi:hypothetical protein